MIDGIVFFEKAATMPASGPIVPLVPYDQMTPAFQARSRQATARLGVQINSVHACAHAEELGGAARDFLSSSMTLGSLPRELRLLIRLAVANANQCRYCTAHQRHQLIGLGVPEAKIAAIGHAEDGTLSPRERAAVRFAQAMTLDAGDIPAAVYSDFIAQFTPQERVEVTIVACAMGMLNKINDALRVPLESEFEALVD
jgi:AhpD family alkylhydroperoxidase